MRNLKTFLVLAFASVLTFSSCNKEIEYDYSLPPIEQEAGKVTLRFENYVGDQPLILGTAYTSNTQQVAFSEVKYIVSNITMTKVDGRQVVYNPSNLDRGAFLIDQSNETSHTFVLDTMAAAQYKSIGFAIGVKRDLSNNRENLNKLETAQNRFPSFFRLTEGMHWLWSDGFEFASFKGTYGGNQSFMVAIGSGVKDKQRNASWNPREDRDAFRYVTIDLTTQPTLSKDGMLSITIKADLDKLLNGTNKVTLTGNIPADTDVNLNQVLRVTNNIAGNQGLNEQLIEVKEAGSRRVKQSDINNSDFDKHGMFSILNVE